MPKNWMRVRCESSSGVSGTSRDRPGISRSMSISRLVLFPLRTEHARRYVYSKATCRVTFSHALHGDREGLRAGRPHSAQN